MAGLQRPSTSAPPANVTLGNQQGVPVGEMVDSSDALGDTEE
jgi:hypothetical protein